VRDQVKKGPRTWQEFFGKPPEMMKLVLVATAAGVIFMTVPGLFGLKGVGGGGGGGAPVGAVPVTAQPKPGKDTEIGRLEEQHSRDLELILSQIEGAGKVHVDVRLATGVIRIPVINTNRQETQTNEKAGDGSTRGTTTSTVTDTNVVVENALAVSKELRPQIAGVLVVADGAGSAAMRYRLTKAAAESLGIPMHLVRVEASERGRS